MHVDVFRGAIAAEVSSVPEETRVELKLSAISMIRGAGTGLVNGVATPHLPARLC